MQITGILTAYTILIQGFSAVSEEEMSRVLRADQLPPCNEDQLMMFLAEIQAINPERIINSATMEELDPLCRKVSASLEKTDAYLKKCEPPTQKDLYVQLIKGVGSLHQKLCVNGAFKTSFKSHYACYHKLSTDFEDCNGPSDWTEDSDADKICAAYKDIADCYYVKTAQLCGEQAAKVMSELTQAVVNSILTVECASVKKTPSVDDAMPEGTNSIKQGWLTYLITCIIVLKLMLENYTII